MTDRPQNEMIDEQTLQTRASVAAVFIVILLILWQVFGRWDEPESNCCVYYDLDGFMKYACPDDPVIYEYFCEGPDDSAD